MNKEKELEHKTELVVYKSYYSLEERLILFLIFPILMILSLLILLRVTKSIQKTLLLKRKIKLKSIEEAQGKSKRK